MKSGSFLDIRISILDFMFGQDTLWDLDIRDAINSAKGESVTISNQ